MGTVIMVVLIFVISLIAVVEPGVIVMLRGGWRYKNAEPTDTAMTIERIGGIIGLVIVLIAIIVFASGAFDAEPYVETPLSYTVIETKSSKLNADSAAFIAEHWNETWDDKVTVERIVAADEVRVTEPSRGWAKSISFWIADGEGHVYIHLNRNTNGGDTFIQFGGSVWYLIPAE